MAVEQKMETVSEKLAYFFYEIHETTVIFMRYILCVIKLCVLFVRIILLCNKETRGLIMKFIIKYHHDMKFFLVINKKKKNNFAIFFSLI